MHLPEATPLREIRENKRKPGTSNPSPHAVKSRESRRRCAQRIRQLKTLVKEKYLSRSISTPDLLEWCEYTCNFSRVLLGNLMGLLPCKQSLNWRISSLKKPRPVQFCRQHSGVCKEDIKMFWDPDSTINKTNSSKRVAELVFQPLLLYLHAYPFPPTPWRRVPHPSFETRSERSLRVTLTRCLGPPKTFNGELRCASNQLWTT